MSANIRGCMVHGSPDAARLWHSVCDRIEFESAQWVADLRALGFKAAHPNDGWVNREKLEFQLVYPQFNDGLQVGDSVMLGWPGERGYLRPVRVTGIRRGGFICDTVHYAFEDQSP